MVKKMVEMYEQNMKWLTPLLVKFMRSPCLQYIS
jgi:hypothetical protein